MNIKIGILLLGLLLGQSVWAAIEPMKTAGDPRVKVVMYNALEVTKITSYTGIGTTIQIDPTETYLDHASGAVGGFTLNQLEGGRLVLKATVSHADTNLTIYTNKRTYLIELKIRDPRKTSIGSVKVEDPNLTYLLYYRYPDIETRVSQQKYKQRIEEQKSQMQVTCDNQGRIDPANLNFNYALTGERAIAPSVVFDDGVFTYVQMPERAPIPSIYSVDKKLNETIMNVRMEGRHLIVVEQLANRFTLRHGEEVVTVIRNPNPQLVRKDKEEEKQYAGW